MNLRTLSAATLSLLALSLALAGCPKDEGTDSAVVGSDSAIVDSGPGTTDSAVTDSGPTTTTFTAEVYEVLDDTNPVMGATVELYDVADNTKTTVIASGMSDAAGLAAISLTTVPANVYAKTIPPAMAMGLDTYSYWNMPVTMDTMRSTPFYSNTTWMIIELGGQMAGMGYASGAVLDCMGNRIAGATVTASSGLVVYVGAAGLPDPMATMTGADGTYVVLNATPGALTLDVDAGAMPAGCTMSTATHDVFARADTPLIAATFIP